MLLPLARSHSCSGRRRTGDCVGDEAQVRDRPVLAGQEQAPASASSGSVRRAEAAGAREVMRTEMSAVDTRRRLCSPIRDAAHALYENRVQGPVRPACQDDRRDSSQDALCFQRRIRRGLLPISRRASEPVAKSGVDAVRFEGTRWIWDAIQENLRTSAKQSTRTTTPRTRPTLPHPTSPPSLDLGTEPELYTTLAKVENRSRHVVVPALVLEHGIAMGEAKHLSDALCVEQVLSGDSRRHLLILHP
jgi:hypothetical protein